MKLNMLKSKIHRVTVTHAELDYEGSCAIDQKLMDKANILPFEQLQIYNLSNGERFSTYAITAPGGSGAIGVNGAAAHKAKTGDLLIICTYAQMEAVEAGHFNPALVYVDQNNAVTQTSYGHLAAA